MILGKLKEATREQHENLESVVGVMDKLFKREDYERLLTKFYKFYSSIEPRVGQNDMQAEGFDFEVRRKTASLESDLKNLGIFDDIKSVAGTWDDLPTLDTPAKAFGACYVMEGATLGGQIIMRHLKEHLDLTPDNGGSFFNSYGHEVGSKWKEFCGVITAFAERQGDDETIVEAARETFDSFGRCFAQTSAAGI
ncbi:MAG: biliverdin-producing heme oxygenase [Chloracidobacterium sp.]|nr:biliverdin-producing heme oxygenase [Chloracidobacterium sp.]